MGDIDLNRLPDTLIDNFSDEDLTEAVKDNNDINDDIKKSQIKRFNGETSLRENLSVAFSGVFISVTFCPLHLLLLSVFGFFLLYLF